MNPFKNKQLLLAFSVVLLLSSCSSSPSARARAAGVPVVDLNRSDYPTASTKEEIDDFSAFDSDPYIVGPADVMKLKALHGEFAEEELKVTPDGKINVSSIGEVALGHRELKDIEKEVNERMNKFYSNVECKLVLITAVNRKVSLLGAVKNPGIMSLESDMTLVDVLAKAGGFDGAMSETSGGLAKAKLMCRIIRENGKSVWIDLKAILFQNVIGYNVRLKSNDILYVYKQ